MSVTAGSHALPACTRPPPVLGVHGSGSQAEWFQLVAALEKIHSIDESTSERKVLVNHHAF